MSVGRQPNAAGNQPSASFNTLPIITPGVAETSAAVSVPAAELVQLCAMDMELYCHTFFPKTFRQKSPPFHRDIHADLNDPRARYVAIEVFRGGGKTTLLRAFMSRRIAYGTSRTIMLLSSSQEHAKRSLRWLRTQVEFNRVWAGTYGLSQGAKWTDEYLEIKHSLLEQRIAVIAVGMTGQTRGVNIDDYRPDLIVVDDPDDEETTATPEQRDKTEARFFGAIGKSLAPAADNPEAKLVLLQTSLHKDDLINRCHADKTGQWRTHKFGVLDEGGNSRWPELFPAPMVLADKKAHLSRGQTLLWLREMECMVGDEETADFKREWLRLYDVLPESMLIILGLDPVPPPSEHQIKTGFRYKDYEVLSVVGWSRGKAYLLEYAASRGHEPEWTIAEFFRLLTKWKPMRAKVEGIAYQRTLKWILEQAMKQRKQYIQIDAEPDRRKKRHRIVQAFSGIASQGNFLISKDATEFADQFAAYPNVEHDDILDATAMALEDLLELGPDLGEADINEIVNGEEPAMLEWRDAP